MKLENGELNGDNLTAIVHEDGQFHILVENKPILKLSTDIGKKIYSALYASQHPSLDTFFFVDESNCHGTTNAVLFETISEEELLRNFWSISDHILWEQHADYYFRNQPEDGGFLPIIKRMKASAELKQSNTPFGRVSRVLGHSLIVLGETERCEIVFEKKGYERHLPFCLRLLSKSSIGDYGMICQ